MIDHSFNHYLRFMNKSEGRFGLDYVTKFCRDNEAKVMDVLSSEKAGIIAMTTAPL